MSTGEDVTITVNGFHVEKTDIVVWHDYGVDALIGLDGQRHIRWHAGVDRKGDAFDLLPSAPESQTMNANSILEARPCLGRTRPVRERAPRPQGTPHDDPSVLRHQLRAHGHEPLALDNMSGHIDTVRVGVRKGGP